MTIGASLHSSTDDPVLEGPSAVWQRIHRDDQSNASSFLLCDLSTDGGTRIDALTCLCALKPLYPVWEVVVGVVVIGARRNDELCGGGTPGRRVARPGAGGRGINPELVSMFGVLNPLDESEDEESEVAARWALLIAGKESGASSSPAVSDPIVLILLIDFWDWFE
ncbi:hypothetical protein C8R48DRAFT_838012 [Suillus tomentosus]|nr:hypothetical protein C8R48DRAFT_838012 [Suillus tomentosus]